MGDEWEVTSAENLSTLLPVRGNIGRIEVPDREFAMRIGQAALALEARVSAAMGDMRGMRRIGVCRPDAIADMREVVA